MTPLTPQQRKKQIFRVTLLGSAGNALLVVFKLTAGIVGGSAAMVADAMHSLSDFLTDIAVVVFVGLAERPRDRDHDFGHGKYETLATAIIGLMLAAVGIGIIWSACTDIWHFMHGGPLSAPAPIALLAAAVSVAVKEVLYQVTARRGRKLGSQAMVANAWHHRTDAISSVGAAIGIGGAMLLGPSWRVLDPLAAAIVGVFIVHVAIGLLRSSLDELLEKSLPDADEAFIISTILSQPGVTDPHNLRTRRIGAYCAIEVHFRMDGNTTINVAHATTRTIEDQLRNKFGPQTIINTHVEPTKPPGSPSAPCLNTH